MTQDCPCITVARGKSLLETPETERSFVGQDPAPKLSTSANSWAPASFNNVAQVLELVKLLLNASASRAQGKWEGTNSDTLGQDRLAEFPTDCTPDVNLLEVL